MLAKIISARVLDDSILTTVECEINGVFHEINQVHFQPLSGEEIETGIKNRVLSEKRKIEASERCLQILSEIEIGSSVTVDG